MVRGAACFGQLFSYTGCMRLTTEKWLQKGLICLRESAKVVKGLWLVVTLGVQFADPPNFHLPCCSHTPHSSCLRLGPRTPETPTEGSRQSFHCLKTCLSTKESYHCLFLLLVPSSDAGCCSLVPIDKVGFQVDNHRRPFGPGVGAATAALRPPATGAATAAHSVDIRAV